MKQINENYLKLMELSPEEKEKRGILARLYGPVATTVKCTRNGRKYSDEVWTEVFDKNAIVNELISNGGIPGEGQHPTDRTEVDFEKIAIMMPEKPCRDKNGKLVAYFDIVDTPCGKIAYQLAKYGFKFGVSSRGTGDVFTDTDGNESVDPTTYDFTCFDLVLIPAVEEARMEMLESVDKNKLNLKAQLTESLKQANQHDRKLMDELIESYGIKIDNEASNDFVAKNDGTEEVVKSLQEALKNSSLLKKQIKSLQEQLAVSNTKVNALNEELDNYKSSTVRLTDMVESNKKNNKEQSSQLTNKIDNLINENAMLKKKLTLLTESKNKATANTHLLTESISQKDSNIKSLQEQLSNVKAKHEDELNSLKESYESDKKALKEELNNKTNQLNEKNNLLEGYKKLADKTANRYIESKALMLGVKPTEFKKRLAQNYTLEDVDSLFESMQDYNVSISRSSLPFDLKNKHTKVEITEAKLPVKKNQLLDYDDDVDDTLLQMAGFSK